MPDAKKPLPLIKTERCLIRLPEISESAEMLDFVLKNKDIFAELEPVPSADYFTKGYWQKKIKKINMDFANDKSCCMNIYLVNTGQLIGMANYSNFIRGAFQTCFLGYKIAGDAQGKGYMTEALMGSIPYIFENLNMHRISAAHILGNIKSARVLEKCGFKQEGVAEDYLFINGKWQAHMQTSLINKNWVKKSD